MFSIRATQLFGRVIFIWKSKA